MLHAPPWSAGTAGKQVSVQRVLENTFRTRLWEIDDVWIEVCVSENVADPAKPLGASAHDHYW